MRSEPESGGELTTLPRQSLYGQLGYLGTWIRGVNSKQLSAASRIQSNLHESELIGPTLYAESKKKGTMLRTAELDRANDTIFRSLEHRKP